MKKIFIYFFVILSVIFATGCGTTSPALQSQIDTCSREANAYSAGQRIGNSAYWNCLEREERKESQRVQRNEQQAQIESLRTRCDAFGFQRNTPSHSQCMYNLQRQDIDANFRAAQINQENARIRQQALRDMNDALKPPQFITPVCPGMLNARPGQYGAGC